MTGLLRAEVRRITSRRAVRAFGALALLIILITYGKVFFDSDRDLAAAHRKAERQAAAFSSGRQFDRIRQECEAAKASGKVPPDFECPTAADFGGGPSAADLYQDPRFHTAEHMNDTARGVAVGVAVMAFVIGASFVGAEWHHGTMQALLFWEPRRMRVLATKAVALVAVLLAAMTFLELLTYGLAYLVGSTRGTTSGMTAELHRIAALTALRGMVVVSFTSLLGYAVAGLARVTAAALGVAFGWFVILENLIRGLRPGWQRYLISENVAAVMEKRLDIVTQHHVQFGEGETIKTFLLRGNRAAITLGIYLALLLGAFVVTFRRRDVT